MFLTLTFAFSMRFSLSYLKLEGVIQEGLGLLVKPFYIYAVPEEAHALFIRQSQDVNEWEVRYNHLNQCATRSCITLLTEAHDERECLLSCTIGIMAVWVTVGESMRKMHNSIAMGL